MDDKTSPVLSVIVPVYNEQAVLPLLVGRLRPVLDGLGRSYEVIAVDDGSTDATADLLVRHQQHWPQLRLIQLRRNCGHQGALTAGLHRSRGRYAVSIDADLQDPPETIAEMLRVAETGGLDVVYGVRADRSTDTPFKRHTAGVYYRLMRRLVGKRVPHQAGDFRLVSRDVVQTLRDLPENQPVYRLLIPWLGFRSDEVRYDRAERAAGTTKYPLARMLRLAFDSVTALAAPLRLATWLGLAGVTLSLTVAVVTMVAWATGRTVPGWTSIALAVLFLGAVQLICLGLLGEYVARIYTAVQQRPPYHVASDTLTDDARAPV